VGATLEQVLSPFTCSNTIKIELGTMKKIQKAIHKMAFVVSLLALSSVSASSIFIGFASVMTASAQEPVDPQVQEGLEKAAKQYDDAFNKNDAVALGALFTTDAVEAGPHGPAYGREAIQQRYADLFAKWKPTDHVNKIQKVYMLGPEGVSVIDWSIGKDLGGYVVTVSDHQGDNWLVRLAVYGITKTPPASPTPTPN
jgi:hypothetical protein